MGPIGCPEMSLRNYHHSLRNNSEQRSYSFRPYILDFGSTCIEFGAWLIHYSLLLHEVFNIGSVQAMLYLVGVN